MHEDMVPKLNMGLPLISPEKKQTRKDTHGNTIHKIRPIQPLWRRTSGGPASTPCVARLMPLFFRLARSLVSSYGNVSSPGNGSQPECPVRCQPKPSVNDLLVSRGPDTCFVPGRIRGSKQNRRTSSRQSTSGGGGGKQQQRSVDGRNPFRT